MANIDLRPWREERRKVRQNQFLTILFIVAGIAAGAGWGWNHSVQSQISFQNTRNSYLEDKIKELDVKIKEIQSLREQRELLIDRMNIIQSLQGDRPIIVHIFEELVEATPEGVFFESLEVKGNQVLISAQADKALSISDFLRNLDESPWFDNAFMQGMQSIKEGQEVIGHTFKLKVTRVNPSKSEDEES
jgi:type IV pilus assembly protein PilN